MCGISWGSSQHGLDLPRPRPFSPLTVSQSGQGLRAAGPGSGSCFFCTSLALGRWLHLSVFLGGSALAAGSLHPFPPAPCAVRGQLALLPWLGWGGGQESGVQPSFSSSSPRSPAFRWGGAPIPQKKQADGSPLAPCGGKEGCSSGPRWQQCDTACAALWGLVGSGGSSSHSWPSVCSSAPQKMLPLQ